MLNWDKPGHCARGQLLNVRFQRTFFNRFWANMDDSRIIHYRWHSTHELRGLSWNDRRNARAVNSPGQFPFCRMEFEHAIVRTKFRLLRRAAYGGDYNSFKKKIKKKKSLIPNVMRFTASTSQLDKAFPQAMAKETLSKDYQRYPLLRIELLSGTAFLFMDCSIIGEQDVCPFKQGSTKYI